MGSFFFILLAGFSIALVFVLPILVYWRRMEEEEALTGSNRRFFHRWIWTGIAVPLGLWVFLNSGLLAPPVWPTVAPIRSGWGIWWDSFKANVCFATFVITSYWAGVSAAWLLGRMATRAADRRELLKRCGLWSLLLAPVAFSIVALGSFSAAGVALLMWCLPLVHLNLNASPEKMPAACYSRALARISFGKYEEAERAVISELERFENDFDGWMMLAELYATHFNDLPSADATVLDLCEQSSITASQLSVALHRLADWHLKFGSDPIRARAVLELVCTRLPGTHLDRMARQRMQQLPADREEWLDRQKGKPMPLPHVQDGSPKPSAPLSRVQAASAADECVRLLQKNPNDVAARETFARLLVENLSEPRPGIEQIELLLGMPGQERNKCAEWLVLIAHWHARVLNDNATAKQKFAEVIRDYSDTPYAFAAQQQLNLMRAAERFSWRRPPASPAPRPD